MDVVKWNSSTECLTFLRNQGYHVVATALTDDAKDLDEIDFTQKTALVLGNEAAGVSKEVYLHSILWSICQ